MVRSGELIGSVGGSETPTHLHFELRQVFNRDLLNQYTAVYSTGLTAGGAFNLSAVTSNLGNAEHSVALDPTPVLYDWERKSFTNDSVARQGRVLTFTQPIASYDEIQRDGLRFLRIRMSFDVREFFIPLNSPTQAELSMITTLRDAFLTQRFVRLAWRDSLFFSNIQSAATANMIVEVTFS